MRLDTSRSSDFSNYFSYSTSKILKDSRLSQLTSIVNPAIGILSSRLVDRHPVKSSLKSGFQQPISMNLNNGSPLNPAKSSQMIFCILCNRSYHVGQLETHLLLHKKPRHPIQKPSSTLPQPVYFTPIKAGRPYPQPQPSTISSTKQTFSLIPSIPYNQRTETPQKTEIFKPTQLGLQPGLQLDYLTYEQQYLNPLVYNKTKLSIKKHRQQTGSVCDLRSVASFQTQKRGLGQHSRYRKVIYDSERIKDHGRDTQLKVRTTTENVSEKPDKKISFKSIMKQSGNFSAANRK